MADGSHTNPDESTLELWRWYPDAPLLTLGGRPMPCAIYPAPAIQRRDVESVIGECGAPVEVAVRDDGYVTSVRDATRAAGRELYDGMIVAMRRMDIGDRLALDWSAGSYFDQLATCEAVGAQWRRGGTTLREKLHASVANPLHDGAGRCAGIGVTTVMRVAADDGPRVWLGRVSDQKAVGKGRLHVTPAAMLELDDAQQASVSVTDTCLREFAEELFGLHADADAPPGSRWWADTEPVASVMELVERGDASLQLAGVSMNLTNLRPEIAVVLSIDTPDWRSRWIDRVALNWEFADALREVRFDDEAALTNDLGDDLAALVPPAAGSLALALNKLGESINE